MQSEEVRKLAAIMFTDMVGYSRIAQENEELALTLLDEQRRILRSFFPIYGGREIETVGDAFFVEFSSALEATNCAIAIQKSLSTRNKGLESSNHIIIRIGIHLGDVVHKGVNVLGDGVNIAARIEPLAPACGICVSEDIARQVQNKIKFPLKKLEKKQLKNIKLPTDVYVVDIDCGDENNHASKSLLQRKKVVLLLSAMTTIVLFIILLNNLNWFSIGGSDKKENTKWKNSVAVLPFTDLSPQKDQEYFCVGMTEQILTNLAKLNVLKVIARTSVMKYKNTQKTIPEIGEELNVKNLLEGSIRKFGDKVRVTAQLVSAEDGSHLWAEDYNRDYVELFDIQDDISKSIADTLLEKLSLDEVNNLQSQRAVNFQAYEYYLKGEFAHINDFWSSSSKKDFRKSENLFLKAIELDSNYAPSFSGLADLYNTYWNVVATNKDERDDYLKLQEKYINRAFDLNPKSAKVNRVMGWVYAARNETEKMIKSIKRSVHLDANDPENIRALGIIYDNAGLKYHAVTCYSRCIDLDPVDPKNYFYLGNAYFHLGKFQKAKYELHKALKMEPNHPKYLASYAMILIQTGDYSYADSISDKYNSLFPDTEEGRFLKSMLLAKNDNREEALAIELREENKVIIYVCLNMIDEAIEYMEGHFDYMMTSWESRYLLYSNHPIYNNLKVDKRFNDLISKHKNLYEANLNKFGDIEF